MWFFKNYGVLWQNARNLKYIGQYNDDLSKKLADSKLKTKEFLSSKWIKVSQTIAVIHSHKELENFDLTGLPLPFVVKPNAWYGWKWIIIFEQKDSDWYYISNDHQKFSHQQLISHIGDILDGFYSLSGSRDKVIFERKIVLDHSVELLWKYGLPDIRVIVFNNIPVIAMLRVPTENSKWKANLHGGACWLWVDIWSWKITYITQFNKMIKSIPGIGDVRGIEVPYWEDILKLAVRVQQITKIWYIGCDIVLDDELGPILLEMNVRPWLGVQIANKVPLLERLDKVANIKVTSVEKGVRLARDLFWGDIEEKIKNISWKKVVWNKEYIEFVYQSQTSNIVCEIKPTKATSYISSEYLYEVLGFPKEKVKDGKVRLKCNILGESRWIRFQVKDLQVSNCILWKEALYGFLVDPFKYKDNELPFNLKNPLLKEKNIVILKSYEEQLMNIDRQIMSIDKKMNILKIITPKNIVSERMKFIESQWEYVMQLEYNEFKYDVWSMLSELNRIEIPEIPLSKIFARKKQEVIYKLQFVKAFQEQNVKDMNFYNQKMFWWIHWSGLEYAQHIMQTRDSIEKETHFLTIDEIQAYVETFNKIYNIDLQVVEKEIGSRFSIKWDALLVKGASKVGKNEIRSIIAHEVETHYLRKVNAKKYKYQIFANGTADYLETEEGLAIYNQNKFINSTFAKYYGSSERYCLIDFAQKNSYKAFVSELKRLYGEDYMTISNYLIRLKRWVSDTSLNYIFIKDVIYVNGFLKIMDFIEQWWDVNELYFWKISIQDLQEIKTSDFIDMKNINWKTPLFFN